jgi:ELWxxDGT repeat protein
LLGDCLLILTATTVSGTALGTQPEDLDWPVDPMLDINEVPAREGSEPEDLTTVGDQFFFTAETAATGRELWRSDGTPEGTTLVSDIFNGPSDSRATQLTRAGNLLYFSATDGVNGIELWRSDGTRAGTFMLRDIRVGSLPSSPSQLRPYQDGLVFVANDAVNGSQIWKTNGTADSTTMVSRIVLHNSAQTISSLTVAHDHLYFLLGDGGSMDPELYRCDGTEEGTLGLLSYPWVGGLHSDGERLFHFTYDFVGGVALWTCDSGQAQPQFVQYMPNGNIVSSTTANTAAVDGKLFFAYDQPATGAELWSSDGTTTGTLLLKDIWEGVAHSAISEMTVVGKNLMFAANDGVTGVGLWKCDSSSLEVTRLTEQPPPVMNINPRRLSNIGGVLYFAGYTPETAYALWKSDGTTTGTLTVQDVPGPFDTNPMYIGGLGTKPFFSATDSVHGRELWHCSEVTGTPVILRDIYTGTSNATPTRPSEARGSLYFAATDGVHGVEPWISDGSPQGTRMISDVAPGSQGSRPYSFFDVGSAVLFSADDGISGLELWRSDGSEVGTALVKDIYPGIADSYIANGFPDITPNPEPVGHLPDRVAGLDGVMYFAAEDGEFGRELWRSDSTTSGTAMVADIWAGASSSGPIALVPFKGGIFFGAHDGSSSPGPRWLDGASEQVSTIFDPAPGATVLSSPYQAKCSGAHVYFTSATTGRGGLWITDGTANGTINLQSFWPQYNSAEQLTLVGERAFYVLNRNSTTGRELWTSDGTSAGTFLVKDIYQGTPDSRPQQLTALGEVLLFSADDGVHGRELWRSDGSAAGTFLVADLRPGLGASEPSSFVAVTGRLFFIANDGINGSELWKSDGTTSGTVRIADSIIGQPGGFRALSAAGDHLYAAATNSDGAPPDLGMELYSFALSDLLDDSAPVPAITGPPYSLGPFVAQVDFGQEVRVFSAEEVTISNAEIVGVDDLQGGRFELQLSPHQEGQVTVNIPAGVVRDRGANLNSASAVYTMDYRLSISPTPSPTEVPPSPTVSPSDSPTSTPTPSASPSPTLTASPNPSASPSNTPGVTSTPTPSPSASPSPTSTSTPTASLSPTLTASPSPIPSPSETPQPSPTATASPSPSPSNTSTPTPTPADVLMILLGDGDGSSSADHNGDGLVDCADLPAFLGLQSGR